MRYLRQFIFALSLVLLAILASASYVALAQTRTIPGRGGGSSGVSLQGTSPGTKQTGNINVSGTIVQGATTDITLTPVGAGDYRIALSKNANAPSVSVASAISGSMQDYISLRNPGATIGILRFQSCPSTAQISPFGTCIQTSDNTPISLGAPTNPVIIDTVSTRTGGALQINNGGVQKLLLNTDGTITTALRGTTSWTPGSIPTGTCASTTITITGASAGADCIVSSGTPALGGTNIVQWCAITANTCTIQLCNAGNTTQTGTPGTYACRVL